MDNDTASQRRLSFPLNSFHVVYLYLMWGGRIFYSFPGQGFAHVLRFFVLVCGVGVQLRGEWIAALHRENTNSSI